MPFIIRCRRQTKKKTVKLEGTTSTRCTLVHVAFSFPVELLPYVFIYFMLPAPRIDFYQLGAWTYTHTHTHDAADLLGSEMQHRQFQLAPWNGVLCIYKRWRGETLSWNWFKCIDILQHLHRWLPDLENGNPFRCACNTRPCDLWSALTLPPMPRAMLFVARVEADCQPKRWSVHGELILWL